MCVCESSGPKVCHWDSPGPCTAGRTDTMSTRPSQAASQSTPHSSVPRHSGNSSTTSGHQTMTTDGKLLRLPLSLALPILPLKARTDTHASSGHGAPAAGPEPGPEPEAPAHNSGCWAPKGGAEAAIHRGPLALSAPSGPPGPLRTPAAGPPPEAFRPHPNATHFR